MQFMKNIMYKMKTFLCNSNVPKGKWKEEFKLGTIQRNSQGKSVFIDSESQAEYSIELPEKLQKSNNTKISLGKIYRNSDNPILTSYIDISQYQSEYSRSKRKLNLNDIKDYRNQGLSSFLIFLFKGNWLNALVAIILPYLSFYYIDSSKNNPEFLLIPAISVLTLLFTLCVILKQWFGIVFFLIASISYYLLLKSSDAIIYISAVLSGQIFLLLYQYFCSKKFAGINELASENFHNLISVNFTLLVPKLYLALFLIYKGFIKSSNYYIAIICVDALCMIYYLFPRKKITDRLANHYLSTLKRFHNRFLDKTHKYIISVSNNELDETLKKQKIEKELFQITDKHDEISRKIDRVESQNTITTENLLRLEGRHEQLSQNTDNLYSKVTNVESKNNEITNDLSKVEEKQSEISADTEEVINKTNELSQQLDDLNQNIINIDNEPGITKVDIADILVDSKYKRYREEYMKIANDFRSIFNGSRLKDFSLDPIGKIKSPKGEKKQPTDVYPAERAIEIICETLQRIRKTNPAIKNITNEELTSLVKAKAIRSYNKNE